MTCDYYNLILKAISQFFEHPFVIALSIFFFSNILIKSIVPGSKQKLIDKVVKIKNLLKEVEFVYNRIVSTGRDLRDRLEANDNVEELRKSYDEQLPKEVSRISNLLNELIPLVSHQIDSDVEIYFNDKKLINDHKEYNQAFFNIQNSLVNDLPKHENTLLNKLNELEGFSFEPMRVAEKKFIVAISTAKSLKLRKR